MMIPTAVFLTLEFETPGGTLRFLTPMLTLALLKMAERTSLTPDVFAEMRSRFPPTNGEKPIPGS